MVFFIRVYTNVFSGGCDIIVIIIIIRLCNACARQTAAAAAAVEAVSCIIYTIILSRLDCDETPPPESAPHAPSAAAARSRLLPIKNAPVLQTFLSALNGLAEQPYLHPVFLPVGEIRRRRHLFPPPLPLRLPSERVKRTTTLHALHCRSL